MIEYEAFPQRCAACPFKTNMDYEIEQLDCRKNSVITLGAYMVGEGNPEERLTQNTAVPITNEDVADFRRGLAEEIDQIDTEVTDLKRQALIRAASCQGVLMGEYPIPGTDTVAMLRKCRSTSEPGLVHPLYADPIGRFKKGGDLFYTVQDK